jgi:hypothetical protein
MPATKGRYTSGRVMTDVRTAIKRKIRAMKRDRMMDCRALEVLEAWISKMDERALTRKGGVVRPRQPLRRIAK